MRMPLLANHATCRAGVVLKITSMRYMPERLPKSSTKRRRSSLVADLPPAKLCNTTTDGLLALHPHYIAGGGVGKHVEAAVRAASSTWVVPQSHV